MPTIVLGLVTIFHPEIYLPEVHTLPHRQQSRKAKADATRKLADEGRVVVQHSYRDVPTIDTGRAERRFHDRIISGAALAPILAEPRIVNTNDEPNPKAKWKIEFRKNWPDPTGVLPGDAIQQLLAAIADAKLRIKGLWINPTLDQTKWSNPEWINLVLVALRHSQAGSLADLEFRVIDDRVCCEWR